LVIFDKNELARISYKISDKNLIVVHTKSLDTRSIQIQEDIPVVRSKNLLPTDKS